MYVDDHISVGSSRNTTFSIQRGRSVASCICDYNNIAAVLLADGSPLQRGLHMLSFYIIMNQPAEELL